MSILVSASILSSDFSNLGLVVQQFENAKADMIHIDIMDGHFVSNLTFGPEIVKAIRPHSTLLFDVHLMITNPELYIDRFAKAGADIITVHYEATTNHSDIVDQIHSHDKLAGISLLPSTSPQTIKHIVDKVDLILVMSVNPGAGGQSFIRSQAHKVQTLASMIAQTGKRVMLSVDGGINEVTANLVKTAGATVLVAGNFISNPETSAINISRLRQA